MLQTLMSEPLAARIIRGEVPVALLTSPHTMVPHCWAPNQTPGSDYLHRCVQKVPGDRLAALADGWVFIVVDLTPVTTRPVSMGDLLWVPVCPDHDDEDTLWAIEHLAVRGSVDMVWGAKAWDESACEDVLSGTDCPECLPERTGFFPESTLPTSYQAVFTPTPVTDEAGRQYRGIVGIACDQHAYVLWDRTAGL